MLGIDLLARAGQYLWVPVVDTGAPNPPTPPNPQPPNPPPPIAGGVPWADRAAEVMHVLADRLLDAAIPIPAGALSLMWFSCPRGQLSPPWGSCPRGGGVGGWKGKGNNLGGGGTSDGLLRSRNSTALLIVFNGGQRGAPPPRGRLSAMKWSSPRPAAASPAGAP